MKLMNMFGTPLLATEDEELQCLTEPALMKRLKPPIVRRCRVRVVVSLGSQSQTRLMGLPVRTAEKRPGVVVEKGSVWGGSPDWQSDGVSGSMLHL